VRLVRKSFGVLVHARTPGPNDEYSHCFGQQICRVILGAKNGLSDKVQLVRKSLWKSRPAKTTMLRLVEKVVETAWMSVVGGTTPDIHESPFPRQNAIGEIEDGHAAIGCPVLAKPLHLIACEITPARRGGGQQNCDW
jgi:hypothetical protein